MVRWYFLGEGSGDQREIPRTRQDMEPWIKIFYGAFRGCAVLRPPRVSPVATKISPRWGFVTGSCSHQSLNQARHPFKFFGGKI